MGTDRRHVERRQQRIGIAADRRRDERRENERRLDERIGVHTWVEQNRCTETSFCHVGDVSSGGMYIDLCLPYPVGTKMSLCFLLPNDEHTISVEGEIVSTEVTAGRLGAHVRFIGLSGEDHIRISSYVEKAANRVAN